MYDQSQQIYRDDKYNDLTKHPVYGHFYAEADYVLTQTANDDHNHGKYQVVKKPTKEVIKEVTNPWDFIEKLESKGNNYKVVVIHVDRTFNIYNLNVEATVKDHK